MKVIKIKLAIVLMVLISTVMWHTNIFPQQGEDYSEKFRIYIQMDRFSFYPDEPIMLNIVIKNNSMKKERFRIFDKLYTTFQPVVFDMTGREAETAVTYRKKNMKRQEVIIHTVPREIVISPQETVTHSVNLRDLYLLNNDSSYRVKGFFFPDAETSIALPSENRLTFSIRKHKTYTKKSGVDQIKRGVSPSEIVQLFLTSEKNEKWKKCIKYIKIDKYITAFSDYIKVYQGADDVEKLKVERDFITFLCRKRNDYIIDFNVVGEDIIGERNIAYVDVNVKRYGSRYPFSYQYKYTLEKFRDYWLIIHVEASVLKGYKK